MLEELGDDALEALLYHRRGALPALRLYREIRRRRHWQILPETNQRLEEKSQLYFKVRIFNRRGELS